MLSSPIAFPDALPAGYEALADEPRFEAARHLALEAPQRRWTLADFGYDAATIAASASPVAVAGPFRMLSDEGVAAARHVARLLQPAAIESSRTARYVTGGVYRSRFLRDLFGSPELAAFVSGIAGAPLAAHAMPAMQLYVNYAPGDINRHVDPWHADSIGFDAVLMVTDPRRMKGGEFQFFRGTIDEAAAHFGTTPDRLTEGGRTELPADKVETCALPGPGWALFQQGNLVVHRAARLLEAGERITMVPGFVARDTRFPDPTNVASIRGWGEPGLYAELARHKAWIAHERLAGVIDGLPVNASAAEAAAALRAAVADAQAMADLLDETARKTAVN